MILLEITKVQRPVQKKECDNALSEYLEKNRWDISVEKRPSYIMEQYGV